jgi:hypothetical protein
VSLPESSRSNGPVLRSPEKLGSARLGDPGMAPEVELLHEPVS